MRKKLHEIRDPIHNFVTFNDQERDLINSRPFQRLRRIHQLGMSHFLYPGANHTRFEHSLGVMELATRVFDRITAPLDDGIKQALPGLDREESRIRWRRTLRMAALCHDLGHLPFSHAAETELLPDGMDHEVMTARFIREYPELQSIWAKENYELNDLQIAKLALGPKKLPNESFTELEAILSEIIVGDTFGVDRMDYLLRDSHHAGVAYGRFDHYRLIDTLRLMVSPPDHTGQSSGAPVFGVEEGGLHAAESLLLARYFMFKQVYYHHVRRVYDLHLVDFLLAWLPGGKFPARLDKYLALTDDVVMTALGKACVGKTQAHSLTAQRILDRQHFRRVYEPAADELQREFNPVATISKALAEEFGAANIKKDTVPPKVSGLDFPVLYAEGPRSSLLVSDVVDSIPAARADYVFADPAICLQVRMWLAKHTNELLGGGNKTDE
ncbi:MAG: HD domain-containing protein [Armatimonadia bacterium]